MSAKVYKKSESHKFVWHKSVWHKLVLCIINTSHVYWNYLSPLWNTAANYKKYVNSKMERQKITLFQHFFLNLLHFSNTICPYSLHFSNTLMFSFINVIFVTRPRFWYWLTLFSLHLCIYLGVMQIYNVKFRLNRQFSV